MRLIDQASDYLSLMSNRFNQDQDEGINPRRLRDKLVPKIKTQSRGWQRKVDLRMVLGGLLIVASFISAYVISQSTSRMVTVWSASVDLAPGEIIEENDISISRVALNDKAEYYLNSQRSIVGTHVLRSIKASELIPAFALSEIAPMQLKKVPVSVSALRKAEGIISGAVVDVYGISRNSYASSGQESDKTKSKLLLVDVAVDSLNSEASKLGGEIGLTLLVPSQDVGRFINSLSEFELILVQST